MAAKVSSVKVVAEKGGAEQELSFVHAERLLRLPGSGWKLPADSPFVFKDNALHLRADKGTNRKK